MRKRRFRDSIPDLLILATGIVAQLLQTGIWWAFGIGAIIGLFGFVAGPASKSRDKSRVNALELTAWGATFAGLAGGTAAAIYAFFDWLSS